MLPTTVFDGSSKRQSPPLNTRFPAKHRRGCPSLPRPLRGCCSRCCNRDAGDDDDDDDDDDTVASLLVVVVVVSS